MQRTLGVLYLMGALSSACSDRDDDPLVPTMIGNEPATGVDGSAPPPLDATTPTIDASTLIDATLGGGDASARAQDMRTFTFDPAMQRAPFDALPGLETDRWAGVLDGAGYRIEVPKSGWNGVLVMYAHGYGGTAAGLNISMPSIRQHLIANGYAWAASSYSTNYYDVRAGVEDTNKLALAFDRIALENGRPLTPTKRYIIGHSMGGHVAGAAVEKEALETARNKVRYNAALPMCGVMADVELFNYFTAYMTAAHQLAGMPLTNTPFADYPAVRTMVQNALFTTFSTQTTLIGETLKGIVMNLSGGARPVFDQGFANSGIQMTVWNTFGGDGTINGILAKPVVDTRGTEYQYDSDPALSEGERQFNQAAYRLAPAPDANPIRSDGVRWIPVLNGEFDVPVLTLHTLGDLYVPFSMQQIYRRRAEAKGNGPRLVQRAIRAPSHCDFTYAEQTRAFDDLAKWEQQNVKPEGDEVLDRNVVAQPTYGCKFTTAPTDIDTTAVKISRPTLPPCPAP